MRFKAIFRVFLTLVLPCNCAILEAQIMTTVAGNGTYGYTGFGTAAAGANLALPAASSPPSSEGSGVAIDPSGNLLIADEYNNVIRKVDAAGIITTIVGDGFGAVDMGGDFLGDGGPALSARFNHVAGLAVDAAGNIYIADYMNARIRKVTASTGHVSTIAGSATMGYTGDGFQATDAALAAPDAVAVDAAGNVYFSDDVNNVVRKVKVSTGVITTVAGNGTAGYTGDGVAAVSTELSRPWGLAVDAGGNLFIADRFNDRIRRVDAVSGIITTVAGNGTATVMDGVISTSTGTPEPMGITFDAAGNYYIATGEGRIRKVSSPGATGAGIITTVAGTSTAGYSGDGGAATLAELYFPIGVAVDATGNIYICDEGNDRIRKVTVPGSASITTGSGTTCQDSCVTFTNSTTGVTDSIRWSTPGITISTPHSNTVSICFPTVGAHTVTLTTYTSGTAHTATSVVTVNPAPHPVVTHSGSTVSVPTVYASYQWYNGTTLIPGATNSSYTFSTAGTYVVLVDSAGCYGGGLKMLGVQPVGAAGTSMVLIPNPNSGIFTLQGNLFAVSDKKAKIEVTNMIGNVVYEKTIEARQGNVNEQISLDDHIPNGIYLLKLSTEQEVNISRFVIER